LLVTNDDAFPRHHRDQFPIPKDILRKLDHFLRPRPQPGLTIGTAHASAVLLSIPPRNRAVM
jgi:hypothetical protein